MEKNKKKIDRDELEDCFTDEESQSIDKMIDEIFEVNEGREPTEEELLAFENCTEEEHFNAIDKIMLKEE